MFDLENALEQWRRRMARGGIRSVEWLDELEDHLRDEFELQVNSGVRPEDAFQKAVAGLGPAAELNAEFFKISRTSVRLKFLQASYTLTALFILLVNGWTLLEYELTSIARTIGIIVVVLTSFYVSALPHWLRSWPMAYLSRSAGWLKAAANLVWVWPLWALLDAGHIVHIHLAIVPMVVIWCSYTALVMTIIAFSLFQRGRSEGTDGWPPPSGAIPIPPAPGCPPEITLPGTKAVDSSIHQVLECARDEAARLGHAYIGTEHLLLGILKAAKGKVANTLCQLHIDYNTVQTEMEQLITAVPAPAAINPIPLTPRAEKAIKVAAREAKAMKDPALAAEHILLGLLLEGSGLGARILRKLGVKEQCIRDAIGRPFRLRRP